MLLVSLLRQRKIATMDNLKEALETTADATVFRKLAEVDYRSSYSQRGGFTPWMRSLTSTPSGCGRPAPRQLRDGPQLRQHDPHHDWPQGQRLACEHRLPKRYQNQRSGDEPATTASPRHPAHSRPRRQLPVRPAALKIKSYF